MALQPVSDRNLADRVADELREAIQTGHLTPGTRLIERRLVEELEVSHIPIREALARLADEGLVDRLPRKGSRVAALTARNLEEISSLRVLLEQFVVVRVQDRWDARTETELRKLVASMVDAATRAEARRIFDLDRRFHERLWKLADHVLLMELASQLRSRINGFLRAANAALEPDALLAHALTHEELVDAIASGNPDAARSAMASHITIAADRIRATLGVTPD